jgi:phage-related protein
MKVRKFVEFIKEEFNDTPEEYISGALVKLKRKIDKMFDFQESEPDEEPKTKTISQAKAEAKVKDEMSFKDLGVQLESSEISKYPKLYDSLTVKFSDDSATYTLIVMIDLKDAMPTDPNKDFSEKDIKKCYIKFKKYDLASFEVVGQITKNTEIEKIDEEFLIGLKIEVDEEFGGEDEEFEIETK